MQKKIFFLSFGGLRGWKKVIFFKMIYMNIFRGILFLGLLILQACSCGNGGLSRGTLRIGIDPNWYPVDFGTQTSYVNGFTEDLLLEIALYSGIEFERMPANWDNLLDGLREKKYDAVLTSLPPYEYNRAKYDFSGNFLDLGPVLIVPADVQEMDLDNPKGGLVGIISGASTVFELEKHPGVIIRNFDSIPDLLNAVVAGAVDAALLDRIPAVNYVGDLYAGKLKIVGSPLTEAGLHLVAPKRNARLVGLFNSSLDRLKKNKTLDTLLKKWQLE